MLPANLLVRAPKARCRTAQGGAPKARCRTTQGGAKRNPGYQASIDISPARAAQKNYRIPNRHIISNSVSPLQGSMLMVLYHPRACALGCSAPLLRGLRPGLCYIAPAGLIDNSPSFDPPCWTSKSARSKHLGLILQSYQFLKGKILPNPFGEVFQADLFGGAPKARCRTAQGGAKRNPGYQASIDISPARAVQKELPHSESSYNF